MNLFHLNMNFLQSQTEKVSRFLIAGMWKLSLDVENEPPVLNEPFLSNVSMKFREKRKPFISSLKFRGPLIRAAQIIHFPHPGSISSSWQLKSVILFLFDFKKSSCLGEKDSHFCLVYGKVYKKIFFIIFHVRGHVSFPGLIFHIQDVENEPPVLKEIPPPVMT